MIYPLYLITLKLCEVLIMIFSIRYIKNVMYLSAGKTSILYKLKLNEVVSTTRDLVQWFGLETYKLDSPWSVLSGGEAQRVIVAIALASRPQVLLLDESTAALDLDAKLRVEQKVREIASNSGMIVLWITHDEDQADRIGSSMPQASSAR